MYVKTVKIDLASFPKSFQLLQQEAILAKSCILTGFELLLKGHFEDVFKGNYYASFFHLSIGLERIMKLIAICDYMMKNNFQPIPSGELRKLGHKLVLLHSRSKEIVKDYPGKNISFISDSGLNYKVLTFLESFADSNGRYFNIDNGNSNNSVDPLLNWEIIVDEIVTENFTEAIYRQVESVTFKNIIIPLQIEDLAFQTGYVDSVYKYHRNQQANHFALWHVTNILLPLISLLDAISEECHVRQTNKQGGGSNYPPFPYFGEIFPFVYLDKKTILKRKRWNEN